MATSTSIVTTSVVGKVVAERVAVRTGRVVVVVGVEPAVADLPIVVVGARVEEVVGIDVVVVGATEAMDDSSMSGYAYGVPEKYDHEVLVDPKATWVLRGAQPGLLPDDDVEFVEQ